VAIAAFMPGRTASSRQANGICDTPVPGPQWDFLADPKMSFDSAKAPRDVHLMYRGT